MSKKTLNLVRKIYIIDGMAKVAIKSEKLTPFGGIFKVMEAFDSLLSPTIEKVLGHRGKNAGYQYSDIIRSLMCVYMCGGSCVEDVSNHLMPHLSMHPSLSTCSSDTILRAIKELSAENLRYVSDAGKAYDFNACETVNDLLVEALLAQGQLRPGGQYDMDFDHQFLETEKYDTKMTYKRFRGYSPGVAVVGDLVVGIENRDGNANVRFHQQDTLERIYSRLESHGVHIHRSRMDCGSCSREIVETVERHSDLFYIRANNCASLYDSLLSLRGWKREEINGINFELNSILVEKWEGKPYRLVIERQRRIGNEQDLWEGEYTYRCILTNDFASSDREVVEFYNQRGGKERILDDLSNGFGWNRLPKSFMAENTVFLLLTALVRNFYKLLMQSKEISAFGLKTTSRIKAFVFQYISVPAKWVHTARQYVLNIYSENKAYASVFSFVPK